MHACLLLFLLAPLKMSALLSPKHKLDFTLYECCGWNNTLLYSVCSTLSVITCHIKNVYIVKTDFLYRWIVFKLGRWSKHDSVSPALLGEVFSIYVRYSDLSACKDMHIHKCKNKRIKYITYTSLSTHGKK